MIEELLLTALTATYTEVVFVHSNLLTSQTRHVTILVAVVVKTLSDLRLNSESESERKSYEKYIVDPAEAK
ncbi:hypothetical protein DICVIV_07037 [Dictyocaulus viviparus]|uniref:Uncharacterized protein n=1 Tax=Dictyocaulus viviparus TaxID=29172 RepID=A0A0D8XQU6_DICVI|nr:hypothetical protein DICVIV_07037 [Dictyocaulus viviparus]